MRESGGGLGLHCPRDESEDVGQLIDAAGEISASASGCRTETRDRPLAERASRGRLLALSRGCRSTVQLGAHFERALFQLQRLCTRLGQVRLAQLVDLR